MNLNVTSTANETLQQYFSRACPILNETDSSTQLNNLEVLINPPLRAVVQAFFFLKQTWRRHHYDIIVQSAIAPQSFFPFIVWIRLETLSETTPLPTGSLQQSVGIPPFLFPAARTGATGSRSPRSLSHFFMRQGPSKSIMVAVVKTQIRGELTFEEYRGGYG